jgi:hypothetical protein
LTRTGALAERESRFVDLIEAAADQMTSLLDLLGLAVRIESGRYEPALSTADTLELATFEDERIETMGTGETIETDAGAIHASLGSLALAAAAHGGVPVVTWRVNGRTLELSPLDREAAAVVMGESPRDFGALVARIAIEHFGGSLVVAGATLRVTL